MTTSKSASALRSELGKQCKLDVGSKNPNDRSDLSSVSDCAPKRDLGDCARLHVNANLDGLRVRGADDARNLDDADRDHARCGRDVLQRADDDLDLDHDLLGHRDGHGHDPDAMAATDATAPKGAMDATVQMGVLDELAPKDASDVLGALALMDGLANPDDPVDQDGLGDLGGPAHHRDLGDLGGPARHRDLANQGAMAQMGVMEELDGPGDPDAAVALGDPVVTDATALMDVRAPKDATAQMDDPDDRRDHRRALGDQDALGVQDDHRVARERR